MERARPSVAMVTVGTRQGSGVILSPNGLVLTLASLAGKGGPIIVTLDDKRSFEATLFGVDEYRNLAVLTIAATGLPAITLGDSSRLTLGQEIAVVGYDAGPRAPTLRRGIINGFPLSSATGLEYIETDAPAEAGSQGGPVINLRGEMVGLFISPSPFTPSRLNHAATSNDISRHLDKLRRGARFFKPTPFSSFPPGSGNPPLPSAYSGTVTIDGQPAPQGIQIVAVIEDYVSEPVTVSGGRYGNLLVSPPYSTYERKGITFYVDGFAAAQTPLFTAGNIGTLNLTVTLPAPQ